MDKVNTSFRLRLKESFYSYSAKFLAQKLLGRVLVFRPQKGVLLAGRIVETEAYLGVKDPASHAYKGRVTSRNRVMYSPPGIIYVYLIYGVYICFNITAGSEGSAETVFIRALEPVLGIGAMIKNNSRVNSVRENSFISSNGIKNIKYLTAGPCRWTKSFAVNLSLSGQKIYSRKIYITGGKSLSPKSIVSKKRIGIDYAGRAKNRLLRFYIKGNPFVSER